MDPTPSQLAAGAAAIAYVRHAGRYDPERVAGDVLRAVAPAIAAQALRDAATAWQLGGWAEKMPEGSSRVALIIGMGQHATDYLRARADRLELGDRT